MSQTDVTEKEGSPRRGQVDWASILAGAAIAAAAGLVFASFTAALGLGSFSADAADHVNGFLLFVAGLFAFLATLAVYFLGGYITGRMRIAPLRRKTSWKRVTAFTVCWSGPSG